MSSDGHFLAAVTDNNLVCIWRYAPPTATVPAGATAAGSVAAAPAPGTIVSATDAAGNPVDSILINIPGGTDPAAATALPSAEPTDNVEPSA